MKRHEYAMELFHQGYNCCQSVFGAFADRYGIEKKQAMMLAQSFGAGMGRMREVCGTVSGMCLVIGMETGSDDPKNRDAKTNNYEMVRKLAGQFKEKNGSIICRELLGLEKDTKEGAAPSERTAEYYKKRPCAELVGMAAKILEEQFGVMDEIA